mgnify:CR=1 FL=1
MPITKSAEKALRQSIHRRKRNLKQKEAYKAVVKEVKSLTAAGKIKEALEKLPQAYKILDKTAKTGFIKKNKAARLKSRLSKLVNKR